MRCIYARSEFRAEGLCFRVSEMGVLRVCKDMWEDLVAVLKEICLPF